MLIYCEFYEEPAELCDTDHMNQSVSFDQLLVYVSFYLTSASLGFSLYDQVGKLLQSHRWITKGE